ncbi:MAG: hypothetical protein ACLT8E_01425 [Akkermansia sp.]
MFATTLFNSGANGGAGGSGHHPVHCRRGLAVRLHCTGVLGFIWVIFLAPMPKNSRVKLAEESAALAQAEKEEARALFRGGNCWLTGSPGASSSCAS